MADILREKIPLLRDWVPIGAPGSDMGCVELYITDASKAKRILGMPELREVAKTAVDATWSLLEFEKATKPATDLRV